MIYCVAYDDVRSYLADLGWHEVNSTDGTVLFKRGDDELTFHAPNADGHVPEIILNDAFDQLGLPVPEWDVFWCD